MEPTDRKGVVHWTVRREEPKNIHKAQSTWAASAVDSFVPWWQELEHADRMCRLQNMCRIVNSRFETTDKKQSDQRSFTPF
jgi:hypothetical protein